MPGSKTSINNDMGVPSSSASITTICSITSVNSALESVVIVLKNTERNLNILKRFDLAEFLDQIISIIKIFEMKAAQDMTVKEQFESKVHNLSINLELIVKLIFFCPMKLQPNSITLVHSMLNYHRFKKTGIFAIYCAALMIQEEQEDCLNNLIPIFGDEDILLTLFESIREVDRRYKDLQVLQSKSPNIGSKDMLEPYEVQTKANLPAGNKQLKMETEAQKEF